MRILVRGDVHLGLVSDGVPRLDEQRRVLDHTIVALRRLNPDVFVDLGDLFDRTRPSPEAYAVALLYSRALWEWRTERFGEDDLETRAYILAGNHDKPQRGEVSALEPLKRLGSHGLGFAEVVDQPTFVDLDDGGPRLIFLPYVTDFEVKRAPRFARESAQEYLDAFVDLALEGVAEAVAFAHLEVPGSERYEDRVQRDVGVEIPRALLEDDRVIRIYAGHVHRNQDVGKVSVVGSAVHVDFGEAADRKGMILAEV